VTIFTIKDLSANNQDIYDLTVDFAADHSIRKIQRDNKLQVFWHGNLEFALKFGRRVVEVASWEAMSAVQEFKGSAIKDLENTERYANGAIDSLTKFVRHLSGPLYGKKDGRGDIIPTRSLLAYPIHHMRFRNAALKGMKLSGSETLELGRSDGHTLCEAKKTLEWIAAYSARTRKEIAGNYQNPGEPQKRVFAKTCIEGWIFLTSKLPSENNVSFADYLSEAWAAVCTEETNWTQAIRAAKKNFDAAKVKSLSANGPDWK
jgi:hypothetical protein